MKKCPATRQGIGRFLFSFRLVGLRFGPLAPRPLGGLMSGCRNQHAEPDLIVRAHHTMCGVLRLFRPSTRLLTMGAGPGPLILSALLNNPRYLTGRLPCKEDYSARRTIWQAFPRRTYWVGRHIPAPPQRMCHRRFQGETGSTIYRTGQPGRATEAYTRSIFGETATTHNVINEQPVPLPQTRA